MAKKNFYINNQDFTASVDAYSKIRKEKEDNGEEIPVVPDDIAKAFQQIAEGLSKNPSFFGYSYREEMVMDGVENCLRAIKNFDVTKPTRSGKPNGFGYFTQICYYAFLRRIAKEKKQQDIRNSVLENSLASELVETSKHQDINSINVAYAYVESVKNRLNENQEYTDDEYDSGESDSVTANVKKREFKAGDSDLTEFI